MTAIDALPTDQPWETHLSGFGHAQRAGKGLVQAHFCGRREPVKSWRKGRTPDHRRDSDRAGARLRVRRRAAGRRTSGHDGRNIGYGDIGWREQREHRKKNGYARRKIKKDGALSGTTREAALRAEIDGEARKAPEDVDMDAVNACRSACCELAARSVRRTRRREPGARSADSRSPKARAQAGAAVAALLAAGIVFSGTATVLELRGNDHTKRPRNCRRARTVQVAQITPGGQA